MGFFPKRCATCFLISVAFKLVVSFTEVFFDESGKQKIKTSFELVPKMIPNLQRYMLRYWTLRKVTTGMFTLAYQSKWICCLDETDWCFVSLLRMLMIRPSTRVHASRWLRWLAALDRRKVMYVVNQRLFKIINLKYSAEWC